MVYLRFVPSGPNLWDVMRGSTKIAEVAVCISDGSCRFIPVESFAYSAEEISSIRGFMDGQSRIARALPAVPFMAEAQAF